MSFTQWYFLPTLLEIGPVVYRKVKFMTMTDNRHILIWKPNENKISLTFPFGIFPKTNLLTDIITPTATEYITALKKKDVYTLKNLYFTFMYLRNLQELYYYNFKTITCWITLYCIVNPNDVILAGDMDVTVCITQSLENHKPIPSCQWHQVVNVVHHG